MATRFDLQPIAIPRSGVGRHLAAWRAALTHDWKRLAWQSITAPWWLWSDMPRLPLPTRNPSLPPGGLAGDWVVAGIDRITRRVWIQRAFGIMTRGIWLTLLVGCLWALVEVLGGPALRLRALVGVGIAVEAGSLMVSMLSRPTRQQVARMLDRSFSLHERITTALGNIGVDVPRDGERASVIYLQVADAANAMTAAQEHPALRLRPPVRELVMAVTLGLAFAALVFARGTGGDVPPVQPNAVPAFVPAAERFVQAVNEPPPVDPLQAATVADVEQMMQTSLDTQRDLAVLSDALADHAITRGAAEQIDRGAYSEAAEELRSVANQAGQLSQAERDALANDLQQAASQMSPGNQTLAQAAETAAEGLRQGDESAQDGMRTLANAVESSGQQVRSTSELDDAMQQARESDASSGQPGSSATGAQGQQPPNQAASGAASEASAPGGDRSGEPGAADAASGAEADGGTGSDAEESSGQAGEGSSGEDGAPGAAQQPGSGEGSEGQQGDAASLSDTASDQAGAGQNSGANQGSGAGSDSLEQDLPGAATDAGPTSEQGLVAPPPDTEASEADVSDAEGGGTDTSGATTEPKTTVTLSRAPQGESVLIGPDPNASRVGPGAGVTVSSGSATQGLVGDSGPDSNHVPPEYRSIVERYFSDTDGT